MKSTQKLNVVLGVRMVDGELAYLKRHFGPRRVSKEAREVLLNHAHRQELKRNQQTKTP